MYTQACRKLTREFSVSVCSAGLFVAVRLRGSVLLMVISSRKSKRSSPRIFVTALVWTDEKRSLFSESLLLNVPIPPEFLYEWDCRYEVMDGQRRLNAIAHFYQKLFPLNKARTLKELNGLRYGELPVGGEVFMALLAARHRDWRQWIDLKHNICYSPVSH